MGCISGRKIFYIFWIFFNPLFLWLLIIFEKNLLNFKKKVLNTKIQQVTEVCLEGLVEDRSELVINPTG
jgi:hypothetical protein